VLRTHELAELAPGEVLVRARYSGISRGTESLVFRGDIPVELEQTMRCPFQEGDFPGPVKYGYSSVGVVEAGIGEEAEGLVGTAVFCLHPHQDRYIVPARAVVPLPRDVPPERAVLAANMETALTGVWDGAPGAGDRVAVVGAGVVGLATASLVAHIPGTEVLVVDPNPMREAPARKLGCGFTPTPPSDFDADLVFHASGHAEGARSALTLAGIEATVIELSWFGNADIALPLGGAFHPRRLTIRSSQVGRIPPGRMPRWDHARRMGKALELLADPVFEVLVTGESGFDEMPEVMARITDDGSDVLCHRVRYGES
jgi:threonine dehydrogenase-like Zn-dependent dehydrogenase